jgi:hypothetical protein
MVQRGILAEIMPRAFRGGEVSSSTDADGLNAVSPGVSLNDEQIESDYN